MPRCNPFQKFGTDQLALVICAGRMAWRARGPGAGCLPVAGRIQGPP